MTSILGISAYYHDSAAALMVDGRLVGAAQEERFTRKKHDAAFPAQAISWCLSSHGISLSDIDEVVFYDKPLIKFERLLETYVATAPRGFTSFLAAMPIWLKEKLYLKTVLRKEMAALGGMKPRETPRLMFTEHHQAHAASAFFPSPFEDAAVLCMDGVGEWATTSAWMGRGNTLEPLWQIDFPHSLGLLYSAFTYFTGFKVNSGEYKLMGLAPYGEPKYVDRILDNLVDIKSDGSFRLNMAYFDYATGLRMTNERFSKLFDRPPRSPESDITQDEMDIAASIQKVTESIVSLTARALRRDTGCDNLCLAGGVALNCVANGKLLAESDPPNLWIQPAAGDAGGALGACYSAWHQYHDKPREINGSDGMSGSYVGPTFSKEEIGTALESRQAVFAHKEDDELFDEVSRCLDEGRVIGWFQGPMEFGPRALGGRSIIGDARNTDMQSTMNLKIKYRESFRPFAPAVLAEHSAEWFDLRGESPYMLIVAEVGEKHRVHETGEAKAMFGIERLKLPRSTVPAITHVDHSARIQTVHKETNPRFHRLIQSFHERTGCPIVVNTSFNVRGEPIVCTPDDAYRCFMRTEMEVLVVENFILYKADQPAWHETDDWRETFELD